MVYINNKTMSVDKGDALTMQETFERQIEDLDGILNLSAFSKRFFGKSQSWFSQRIHHSVVMYKSQIFKEKELDQIACGFKELAKQLERYANEIEMAK